MKDIVLVRKVFNKMLIPTILMNLVTCVSTAADTIIVGNFLGEEALAAVTFSTPVYMLINTLGALLAVGGTTAMSIAAGRGQKEKADELFSSTLILGVIISAILAAAGAYFITLIVKILGAQGVLAVLTESYSVVVFYLTPAFIINISLAFLVRSDGRPDLAMSAMLISIVANIILNLIFIGPLGMGIAGAAWATGISQIISAAVIMTHFASKKNTLKFIWRRPFAKTRLIFKSGGGTSLHFIYQFLTLLFFNNLIMLLGGGDGIVVYTVIMNISAIAMSLFEGLSQTVQPMVSVYYGENNRESIKMTLKLAGKMTLILGGGVTLFLEISPYSLIMIFGLTEPHIIEASATAIRIFSISIIIMTFNAIMSYYYQSVEKSMLAATIVILRNFVMVLLGAALLGNMFGLNGIWGAYLFAETVTLIIWLMYAIFKGSKSLDAILMLPPVKDTYVRYMRGNKSELHETLLEIKNFLIQHNVDTLKSGKIMLAVDELVTNIINYNTAVKLTHIEVRLVISEEILLIIRDDGILFDHSLFEYAAVPQKEGGHGIYLVRKTANSFEYRPVLGFNRTFLKY